MADKTAYRITTSDNKTVYFEDTTSGYTTNAGTITSIATGPGLVGGTITSGSGTIKCDLKSETKSTLATGTRTSTSGREYLLGRDANGDLSVNIPWTDTTYSAGTNISISSGAINVTNVGVYSYSTKNSSGSTTSSVANGTNTNLVTLNLVAGVYLVCGSVIWGGQSQNGYRNLHFSTSSATGTEMNRYATSQLPAWNNNSADTMHQQVNILWNNTSQRNIHLVGYQNSGVSINVSNGRIFAVRIK